MHQQPAKNYLKKVKHANDIYVKCKEKQLKDCETTLDKDLKTLGAYF